MSHFTVLVVTDTPEQVEKVLQPFHEYECTGIEDQYVVDVDKTEEVNEWLAKEVYYGKDRETQKWDYHYNEEQAKENLQNYSACPIQKGTFASYFMAAKLNADKEIEDYFDYEKRGNAWFRRTNPNAKWDWWVVGGRWSGLLKLKPGSNGAKGDPGLLGSQYDANGADQAFKRNVDFKSRMDVAEEKASREDYIAEERADSVATFAILMDGKWMEKGKMGWWACVSGEDENWTGKFHEILDSIPDDKLLTVVDCHI